MDKDEFLFLTCKGYTTVEALRLVYLAGFFGVCVQESIRKDGDYETAEASMQ